MPPLTDPIVEARKIIKRYKGHGDTYVSTINPKPLLDVIEALADKCEQAKTALEHCAAIGDNLLDFSMSEAMKIQDIEEKGTNLGGRR